MRLAVLLLSMLASCTASSDVELAGDLARAKLIEKLIKAAESGDEHAFALLTTKSSTMPELLPPNLDQVDRRDEGCSLKCVTAELPKLAEAIWDCPGKNYKQQVERTFLVEHGRVTYMWNDRSEPAVLM